MQICKNCGFENKDRDLICMNCFEKLEKDPGPTPSPYPPSPDPVPPPEPVFPEPTPVPLPTPPGPTSKMQPGKFKLTVEQGLVVGKSYILFDDEVNIGRTDEEENLFPEIDLSDQEQPGKYCVSRKHVCLYLRDKIYLKDVGSSRGTLLNKTRLKKDEEVVLTEGDSITLGGSVKLRLLANEIV